MPTITVNGAELYHEVRGSGPPVLLIMGATGDGGHFDALADVLADEFTVISYDRRATAAASPRRVGDDIARGAGRRCGRRCWMRSGPVRRRCSAPAPA